MKFNIKTIQNFAKDDFTLLQKNLGDQFQKHFDLLVETVPSIKSIEWTSSQEDEMAFDLINFNVFKNNGYIFEYYKYDTDQENTLSLKEFNAKEIALILEFKNYLDSLSRLIVVLLGSESFKLDKEKISVSSVPKVKI